jgi:2-oxoglutarate ferredoxin oxidoreductase subunit alpha
MTPVVLLTDGYIANGSEPWLIPDFNKLERIKIDHPTCPTAPKSEPVCPPANGNGNGTPPNGAPSNGNTVPAGAAATAQQPPLSAQPSPFLPYARNADLSRPWALPGAPGLEHRLGGLEKQDITGNVSYDPANHQKMVSLRAAKVAGIKPAGPAYLWTGPQSGDLLILGWGGTFGAIKAATLELQRKGHCVSACHLRYINPMPADLGDILKRFKKVLIPELNMGQLRLLIRGRFAIDAKGLNKVQGQPFTITDITTGAKAILNNQIQGESMLVSIKEATGPALPAGG